MMPRGGARPGSGPKPKPKPEPQIAEQSDEPEAGPEDFTLLGIVVANDDKTALLRFNKTNEIFHLKSGQSFSDWQLSEIGPKSVVVKKAELSFSLQLFEQPADAAEPQQQVEEPQQLRRLQQFRQRRQLQQPPQSKSRRQPSSLPPEVPLRSRRRRTSTPGSQAMSSRSKAPKTTTN